MLLGNKIELQPNKKQANYLSRSCGVARFAYNWALNYIKDNYEKGTTVTESMARKHLNAIKKEEFPWMLEVTKNSPQQAIKDLGTAFKRFFKGISLFPQFKRKGVNDSFRVDNGPQTIGEDAVKVIGNRVYIPKIGMVKMREKLRIKGQIKSAVISRNADRWLISFCLEPQSLELPTKNHGDVVGVDVGIKHLVTLSTGEKLAGPKAYNTLLYKLRKRARNLSRKQKGSNNRNKAKLSLARLHRRIANVRRDCLHKLTHYLTKTFSLIGIENLNVSGMLKNFRLARSIMDQGFYEFKRQLLYKAKLYGSQIVIADLFFASSKLCHVCGHKNIDLSLKDRHWCCKQCNTLHDRDINAAKNLKNYASTVSSTETRGHLIPKTVDCTPSWRLPFGPCFACSKMAILPFYVELSPTLEQEIVSGVT